MNLTEILFLMTDNFQYVWKNNSIRQTVWRLPLSIKSLWVRATLQTLYERTLTLMIRLRLRSVCEEANCPSRHQLLWMHRWFIPEPRRQQSCAIFSQRAGRVKIARSPLGPSALAWRLSKNKNRPLGYVNMADENLLSRSRSTGASRPRVTPGNKERAAF